MERFLKRTLAVVSLLMFFCAFAPLQAQTNTVTIDVNNASLRQVFDVIEKQTPYRFAYQDVTLDGRKDITINEANATVPSILDIALKGRDMEYVNVSSKSIVITKKGAKDAGAKDKITVSGKVTDINGEPIIGASVRVKDSNDQGAITDLDGNYSLSVSPNDILEIRYIGYVTTTKTVNGNSTTLNVKMREDEHLLDEVVVVGYGSQVKVNLTGSVASISSSELADRPITSVAAGIQGLVPGLTITNSQGRPGEDSSTMRIRGTGTLNNAAPYVLIDGIEGGSMNQLDPSDIESISVLKDAASAAIYGSKAANGVILITTKRGKSGRPVLTYSGSIGWQKASGHIERMNSADAATYYNRAVEASGKSPRFTDEDIKLFRDGTDPYGHPDTDWNSLGYQGSGFRHQHNVNITGGSDNTQYMASIGYLGQEGIMKHSSREQFNVRTNLDMKLSDKFTVHANLAYINNRYDDPTNSYVGGGSDQIIRQINLIAPWIPYKNEDGSYGIIGDGNPIAWLDLDQKLTRKTQNFQGIFSVDYQIIDGLKFTAQGAYVSNVQITTDFLKDIQYNESKYHGPNSLSKRHYLWNRPSLDLLLNYDKRFGKHSVKALLGYKIEKYNYEELQASRQGFPNNDLTDIDAGTSSTQTNSGYTRELSLMSYFGRINYDYAGKYLFEANFRADGSSRFSPKNRWGYYPSLSAGWRISEEAFMEDCRSWLQSLKVRGSWGQLGNQDALTDYYPWLVTYDIGLNYPFGGTLESGIAQSKQKLETISWEKSTTWGLGFDMSILNSLQFSFEYYSRKTTGIIMDVPVPGSFGLSAYKDNVGAMRNSGIEITLGYNRTWGDWIFHANGNMAINRNEILNLGGVDEMINSYIINRVGNPYNAFYGYIADGLFQSQEEADAYTEKYGNPFGKAKAFKPGDIRYKDVDGDGKLTSKDRDVISSEQPKFTFGLNIGASWKNIDASVLMQGACGVARYFNQEVIGTFGGDATHPSTAWFDAWSPENPGGKFPRIIESEYTASYPDTPSSFWIFNTNYLRIKNIQIGYTLPANWMSRLGISRARIYYSGENLFKFDNLPVNIDPESPSGRGSHYPQVSTNSFGINLTF